jgi:DNA-3-methyladenine glycosylase II
MVGGDVSDVPPAPARRPPVDDLGIVTAIQRLYRLRKKPRADRIHKIGDAWRPYRTVACWYLWRSLENQ